MDAKLLSQFEKPGKEYRGKPFWAWNGRLEREELRRQVRIMKRMGLGGFFMHSRVGLDTPYLSKEWFGCVGACVDEAREQDMEAWLYDEDRWPSGAAGGLVTKNPKFRYRALALDILPSGSSVTWDSNTVAAFTADVEGGAAANVMPLRKGARAPRGPSILVFRIVVQDGSDWYNGYTYLDTLSHEAVREFIKVTHEAYRKNHGTHFGKEIPGIFTDEPNYGHVFPKDRPVVPWTAGLPAIFKKRYGYDIVARLPEVFFQVDGNEVNQARYHFMDCITFLFTDAFARQIGDWCDKNGIAHTGHVLCEESLESQVHVGGSAMRFYEYMQAPGMDILTEYQREYDTAKQVSSAAHQFGRKWRLTETYGCTGWDFPFAGHKAIGDWQAALGINLRCQHLSWYTMEGEAKRDYPAGIFYQSPWWESYGKVEDYFARIHAVMTRGEEVRDLLVIHPNESMWIAFRHDPEGTARPERAKLAEMMVRMRDSLLAENIDFDYGDEDILSRHGSVQGKGEAARLRVAKASYGAVVVPPLTTIRASTLALLERFVACGGTVVFAGTPAQYVDALPDTRARLLAARCPKAPAAGVELARAVESCARQVSIEDAKGNQVRPALYLLRQDKDACYLFVCNTGHDYSSFVNKGPYGTGDRPIRLRTARFPKVRIAGFQGCTGHPIELDPDTGRMADAQARRSGTGWVIETSLDELGSRLFVVPRRAGKVKGVAARRKDARVATRSLRSSRWETSLDEPNVLVLDRPSRAVVGKKVLAGDEILRIDRAVRAQLGLAKRGGAMKQPWAQDRKDARTTPVTLTYTFSADTLPSGEVYLAIERPELYTIRLNGKVLDTECRSGWWVDRSLERVRIDPCRLKTGANELVLACAYGASHPGFEMIYLLGAFGVKLSAGRTPVITKPRQSLTLGDWTRQGLPFYSGSVGYTTTIKPRIRKGQRLAVRVNAYRGVAARVLVNGIEAGVAAWAPNEVDITDLADAAPASLCVEVLGHRRNSHGPLHWVDRHRRWTGPGAFMSSDHAWTDDYLLVPCGLMEAPELVVIGR